MVHQSEDQLFKYATKEDGIGLLKLLKESNANIKEIDFESENLTYNPTELVELDPKIYKTDMILELDHLIVLTEFQSTIVKTPDEKRYRLYTALVDYAKRNNKPIMLIVISTAEKTKIKQYKINKDCVFTIPIVSLKDFDGEKIINNIENKIKNNQKITRHEMLNLALAPFMSSKKPLNKQIEKTVKTLDEVRKSMKCSSDFVFGIELLIVEKFIKNERQHKKLTNILRDTMKIIDEWRQEDYENGKQQGKEEEKINTAKNMLKENYTVKQISKITQLNIESIKQIKTEFAAEQFEVQIDNLLSGGVDISISKGGLFKAVLGLKSALKVSLIPKDNAIAFEAGIGIFGQQAIPTIISMLFFWPVLITQIWGIVQQSKLDDKALEIAEEVLKNRDSFTTLNLDINGMVFCTNCGYRNIKGAKFCSECGQAL